MKNRYKILLLLLVLLAAILLGLSFGNFFLPFKKTLAILFSKGEGIEFSIVKKIRLPRVLLAVAVGGGLSIAGVLFQGMFRNPLVEPYTLGVSGGAALGVSINMAFLGLSNHIIALPLSGFLGAVLVVLLLYFLGFKNGGFSIRSILLTGVMISFISSSFIMFIMAITKKDNIYGIVFWTMGSLDQTDLRMIVIVFVVTIVSLIISLFFAVRLNALTLGEESASNLGIKVENLKKIIFILASLLTGFCVSVTGIIGFVGLVVPHFVRMFISQDHRIMLISSFITGAIFLLFCDLLARVLLSPVELPVGVVTGVLGGILFIYALNKQKMQL